MHGPFQAKLRLAAKAKIIRWVKRKTKRRDRVAPELVQKEWANGNRNALADLLFKVNFQEDWSTISIKLFLQHGWQFEQELDPAVTSIKASFPTESRTSL